MKVLEKLTVLKIEKKTQYFFILFYF